MLNDCHQTVSAYCCIYLYSNSVLCSTPKSFDFKMLLELFEKQLYLPAIFIKFSNLKCRYMHRIGYEYELPFLFFIPIFNQSNWLWIILFRIESSQKYTCVWKHILRQPTFPFDGFVLAILFCSDNEVGFNLMNLIQHLEVVITAVKDVIRAWFIRDFNHRFRIVYGCFCDMKECRDLRFCII